MSAADDISEVTRLEHELQTTSWRRDAEGWRLVHHQGTPLLALQDMSVASDPMQP